MTTVSTPTLISSAPKPDFSACARSGSGLSFSIGVATKGGRCDPSHL